MKGWECLGFATYYEYLSSDIWKERRDIMLEKYSQCQICGIPKKELIKHWEFIIKNGKKELRLIEYYQNNVLQVHHLTYENVSNESESDLLVVCIGCHQKLHGVKNERNSA